VRQQAQLYKMHLGLFRSTWPHGNAGRAGSLSNVAKDVGLLEMEAPLKKFGRQVQEAATAFGGTSGGPITDIVTSLADEIAAWIGVGNVVMSGVHARALPAPERRP
jgi:hypothetical protein